MYFLLVSYYVMELEIGIQTALIKNMDFYPYFLLYGIIKMVREMRTITIGLFNDSFPPMTDGVGMVVDNYARRLSKFANVVVFVPDYREPYDDSIYPYKIVRCKSVKMPFADYSLPLPLVSSSFRREVKKYNFDIIHIHSPFTVGKYAVNYARRHHIPVIATLHSQFEQDFLRAVNNPKIAKELLKEIMRVFNRCDRCYAVNSGIADLYYEEYGAKEKPLVLPNATEMTYVEDQKKSRDRINQMYSLKDTDKAFLFVGRINKLKNILFIVDSLEKLNQKKLNYSYKMLFVGHGQDEKLLKEYIHKKKLDSSIILCGNCSDRELLRDYYVRSDLFLFPSLYDASSIVQIEAASQKVPTVFLKGSKTASDITDRVNGFIAEDEEDFANIIDEVMNDKDLYKKVSEGAYRDVYKNWDMVIQEVFELYQSFVNKE